MMLFAALAVLIALAMVVVLIRVSENPEADQARIPVPIDERAHRRQRQ